MSKPKIVATKTSNASQQFTLFAAKAVLALCLVTCGSLFGRVQQAGAADPGLLVCLQETDDAKSLAKCQQVIETQAASAADRAAAHEHRSLIFDRRGEWAAAAREASTQFKLQWPYADAAEEIARARCANLAQRRYGRQLAMTERVLQGQQGNSVLVLQKVKLLAQLAQPERVRAECKLLAGPAERICSLYLHAAEHDAKGIVAIVDAAKLQGGWAGPEALLLRGMARYRLREVAGAEADFDDILAVDHEFKQPCSHALGAPESVNGDGTRATASLHAVARYGRALVRIEQGDLAGARQDVNRVTIEYPRFGEARMARAFVLALSGETEAAAAERLAALPLLSRLPVPGLAVRDAADLVTLLVEPTTYDALVFRADLLDRANKKDSAARYRQRALTVAGNKHVPSTAQPIDVVANLDRCLGQGKKLGEPAACDAIIGGAVPDQHVVADAYAGRAMLREKQGDHDGAIGDLSRAIVLSPNVAVYYLNRGANRERRQQIAAALTDYSKAIELDRGLVEAYLNRASLYGIQKRFDLGIADYTAALQLRPDFPEAWAYRGHFKERLNDVEGALSDLSRSIELDPKFFFARVKRAEIYADTARPELSIKDSTAAIEIDGRRFEPYLNRGVALDRIGKFDQAFADYLKAVQLGPDSALAHATLGSAHSRLGDGPSAMKAFARAEALDSKLAVTFAARGAHLAIHGDRNAAIADLSKAIGLDATKSVPFANRSNAWNDLKQYDQAISDATTALTLDPRNATAWGNRAFAHLSKQSWSAAIADYSRMFELGGGTTASYYNRGFAHARLGDTKRAVADHREALRIDPSYEPSKRALRNLGHRP